MKRDNLEPDSIANQRITSIILAGGQSKRMGQDKALLELNGIPLLTRTCHLSLQYSNQVYVVSARDYSTILPKNCHQIDDRFLEGPLVAFAEAVHQIPSQPHWYLLLSCDLPYLNELTLNQWMNQLPNIPNNAIAYLAKNPQGYHEALCGFYRSNCWPSLVQSIESGERSFQRWLRSQTVTELQWDDRQVFFNCNHPEDWAKVNQTLP